MYHFLISLKFQFQYGAIKGQPCSKDAGCDHKFQFQYGAIKGVAFLLITLTYIISIPVWCD